MDLYAIWSALVSILVYNHDKTATYEQILWPRIYRDFDYAPFSCLCEIKAVTTVSSVFRHIVVIVIMIDKFLLVQYLLV